MPRPARVLAVSGALVAAGVLAVGGTAYGTTQAPSPDDTYVACVDLATGAMRLIDPLAGHACTVTAGPGQERQISWSRTAGERGPQGPAGPRGARGEAGEDGDSRLEDLAGLRCTSGDDAGRVEIHVESPERGSGIKLICMTGDTVIAPSSPPSTSVATTPPRPTKPPRPTEPAEPTHPPAPLPDPSAEPTADWPREPDADPDAAPDLDPLPAPANPEGPVGAGSI